MKRRAFLGLGATSIGVGALYGTGAFSSVSAGRGVSINASDDSEALIGIKTTDSGDKKFINNSNGLMTIELNSDDEITFDGQDTLTIEDLEDSQVVELGGSSSEDAEVSIFATIVSDGITTGTISLERKFTVPQVSAIRDIEETVNQVGGSGFYRFDLENTQPEDGITVKLNGISVDSTDNDDAYQVGDDGDDIFKLDDEPKESIVDEILIIGGDIKSFSVDSQSQEENIDNFVRLEPGEQRAFELTRFREEGGGGGSQVGVNNVDITVRDTDGNTAPLELRPPDE